MVNLDELKKIAGNIEDECVRGIVMNLLENPALTFTDAKPVITLEESPAAPRKHHFFTGGLILHTISVARIALALSNIVKELYGFPIDSDIVLAVALLHDIFKYYQYAPDRIYGGYKARDDWYLGHDYAIVAELAKRGAPDKLIRAVSEVHGLVPFTTLEGLIVHLADSVDARIGESVQNMLLARVKELEARQCQIYKALNDALFKHGLSKLVSLMFNSVDELRRVVESECKVAESG